MKNISIYLAGKIKKEHENPDETYWTDEDLKSIRSHLPNYHISFLNPAFRSDDLSDQHSVFGRDMLQVASSDIVCVDARDRRGLGVGAEMMWAKFHKIPVVCLAPKNTHYHKEKTMLLDIPVSDWIHPFVESLSDKIVENTEEAAYWIDFFKSATVHIKDIEFIKSAMKHYKQSQFSNDKPMQDLTRLNQDLMQKVEFLTTL